MPAAAYPFIEVRIDTSALQPVAQRSPGVIAVVGRTPAGANGGTAAVNTPLPVYTAQSAAELFARVNADGSVAGTTLYQSLLLALQQDPKPSKIYGVRVAGDNYAAALAGLEAADDVTFVGLANEVTVGAAAAAGNPATGLMALKEHVETMSAQGQKRLGVAMVDPDIGKSNTYVADLTAALANLKSDSSRMVVVAARGATADAATAAMSAIAGYAPHISMVLKRIRGISMPIERQYSPAEIVGLSDEGIIPIIDPELIVGSSLHFSEGRCFTSDASMLYIDIVRTLDDIEFRLKAGLIGLVGDARITRAGMTRLKTQVESILGPLKRNAVITDFSVDIPVLDALNIPESAQSPTDTAIVTTARANRSVDLLVSITYGPAVHRLRVTLAPKF
ncbi:MAG: hypothetical protein JJT90_12215 [Ectothiorhodospiraceae bacterium]|nr:hypothetical protein [Ectothiorhodospiraceae bacterium]